MAPDSSQSQIDFATAIVRRLRDAGAQALWAGGCVRDLLRNVTPGDYDVATSATPDMVRNLFGRKRTLAVGESFGVIIVLPPEGLSPVEVATFRTEGPYIDGRRPQSVVFATAEEDAQRRDFTINGMFYDPVEGRVLDFVGGQADLAAGIIRAIGDPHARMREDKLRLLRAVRFAAVLGFDLDPATADAVTEMSPELSIVSVERIAQELRKMLKHGHRRRAVELCLETRLLDVIFPQWSAGSPRGDETLQWLERLDQPSFALALAVLLRELPDPAPSNRRAAPDQASVRGHCRRLKLSNDETETCRWLHHHQHVLDQVASMTDAELKRLLAHPYSSELQKWLAAQASLDPLKAGNLAVLTARSSVWSPAELNPPPLVTGQDILALGLKPGPRLKELLDAVRTAQLNGEINSSEDARDFLRRMVHDP